MAATFATVGELPESLGFDDAVTPPWTMVPSSGTRRVVLRDGQGLTLALRSGSSAGVGIRELGTGSGGRIIELSGRSAGKAILDALDASRTLKASLEISVKDSVRLATFIAFVFDKTGRGPGRGLDDALSIIEVANKLLRSQTNVEMFRKDSGPIRVSFDMRAGMPADLSNFKAPRTWLRGGPGLLPCISSRPLSARGCELETAPGVLSQDDFKALVDYQMQTNIVNQVQSSFDYNILCVRNLASSTGLGAVTGAFTPVSSNGVSLQLCFLPDSARGQSLAHELCHFLLRNSSLKGGHSNGPTDLMSSSPGPQNLKIPKDQANAINPSGT